VPVDERLLERPQLLAHRLVRELEAGRPRAKWVVARRVEAIRVLEDDRDDIVGEVEKAERARLDDGRREGGIER